MTPEQEPQGWTCVECGDAEHGRWVKATADRLRAASLCFNCGFWHEHFAEPTDPNTVRVIVGGMHYYALVPTRSDPRWRGHAGRQFRFLMNDGRVVESVDVWSQGPIPERFRDRLPDNAVFASAVSA